MGPNRDPKEVMEQQGDADAAAPDDADAGGSDAVAGGDCAVADAAVDGNDDNDAAAAAETLLDLLGGQQVQN